MAAEKGDANMLKLLIAGGALSCVQNVVSDSSIEHSEISSLRACNCVHAFVFLNHLFARVIVSFAVIGQL